MVDSRAEPEPRRTHSYSEEEAEAILKLATHKTFNGTISRQTLFATAAELGISPEAVEQAERELVRSRDAMQIRSAFDKRRRAEFTNSLGAAIVSLSFLCAINYYTAGRLNWVIWVMIFWGYQVLKSGWEAFGQRGESYETAFQKWKEGQERPHSAPASEEFGEG